MGVGKKREIKRVLCTFYNFRLLILVLWSSHSTHSKQKNLFLWNKEISLIQSSSGAPLLQNENYQKKYWVIWAISLTWFNFQTWTPHRSFCIAQVMYFRGKTNLLFAGVVSNALMVGRNVDDAKKSLYYISAQTPKGLICANGVTKR